MLSRQFGVLFLLIFPACAMADGKMYWRETIPPDIPYQRALILHTDGIQTLVLQSKYEIPEAEQASVIGWVVPVPSLPELASMPAEDARHLFLMLGLHSRPNVIYFFYIELTLVIFGLIGIALWALFFWKPTVSHNRKRLIVWSLFVILVCLLIAILAPALSTARIEGVDIIDEQRVGIYDVRVVRSDDADALIVWLNKNAFQFDDEDRAAFDSYIAKNWCFVTAHINPTLEQHNQGYVVSNGLAAPLILRFPHENPVYPVALTGTGGYDTEILIYLLAEEKMTCHDRMTLRYAGEGCYANLLDRSLNEVDPKDFFQSEMWTSKDFYLCKFSDTLTPEQMKEDIYFVPAGDNKPYRELIIKW